jgi:phosphoenolpyruvate-protein phosphotransferase (PTS system enzyme I)
MIKVTGISASPGIAIGQVFLYLADSPQIPEYSIDNDSVENELRRFREAVQKSEDEIADLKKQSSVTMRMEEIEFLDSHMLMLNDPDFINKIEHDINEHFKNIEWVLYQNIQQVVGKLDSVQDVYLRERVVDIYDVTKRILDHLMYHDRISLSDIEEEVILVTHSLLPSDALTLNKSMVKGIAMDAGGKTSHTAILARAFEIPAVLGLSTISTKARSGDLLIIDGNAGEVIVNPDKKTLSEYRTSMRKLHARETLLLQLNELPAQTKDGLSLSLKANIEVPEEIAAVSSHGAEGIGLYRSEFLFMQPGKLPNEDDQYHAYRRVVEAMSGKSVTIRTLDLGGDKLVPELTDFDEQNPILGWRAIRFCLSRTDIFISQLRALFRASVHGSLRIMFPMISGVTELNRVMEIVARVKHDLEKEGVLFDKDVPIGIMIEIPSAALTSDILSKQVDFFSIGTNDLIQYTIAVDRGNEKIAYLYDYFHPAVLRLLKIIIESAHTNGITVGMCGEMAADPLLSVFLLGLGLDELSMGAFSIPAVKQIIRSVTIKQARDLTETVLKMEHPVEISDLLSQWNNKWVGADVV